MRDALHRIGQGFLCLVTALVAARTASGEAVDACPSFPLLIAPAEEKTPELEFGTTCSVRYLVKNRSNSVVEIASIKHSCGCTDAQTDKVRYGPGETGYLDVTVVPPGPGELAKFIVLETRANERCSISVRANVVRNYVWKPEILRMTGYMDQVPRPVEFDMYYYGDDSNAGVVRLKSARLENRRLAVEVLKSEYGASEAAPARHREKLGRPPFGKVRIRALDRTSSYHEAPHSELFLTVEDGRNEDKEFPIPIQICMQKMYEIKPRPLVRIIQIPAESDSPSQFNELVTVRGVVSEKRVIDVTAVSSDVEYVSTVEALEVERNVFEVRIKGEIPAQKFTRKVGGTVIISVKVGDTELMEPIDFVFVLKPTADRKVPPAQ